MAVMTAAAVVAATGLLLQLPLGAAVGIAGDRGAPRDPPRPPAPSQKAPPAYQLRCWQHGRLLFDEAPVTLGPEVRQGARLVAIDRNGAPLMVTVAGETTCQVRPYLNVPNLALPH
ncbi:hypothetical protein UC35_06820 [Ramlibacter tataouinensis]|uniref:Uncharacterized protein n=1 Tax=Ramlibacter tataouinensis TaxID=94132 RepID=A0A127JRM8_9BURK|nr:hypothetical protein UC35_06820 [Ramlibacter tataouinensis]